MNWKLIRIIDTYFGIPLLLLSPLVNKLRRQPPPASADEKRILLIKFWGIGNIFMILPAIQALRKAHPFAIIDFLTLESNRDALAAIDSVDNLVAINTDTVSLFITTWMRGVSLLKKNNYDIIIDFEQFAHFSALVSSQIGARELIGFRTRSRSRNRLFSRSVPYDNTIHVTRSFFSLAIAAGASDTTSSPPGFRLPGLDEVRKRGRTLLVENGFQPDDVCVVIHIGTSDNFHERRWPPRRYAELADLLVEQFAVRVVFTGLPGESVHVREAVSQMRLESAAVDLCGQLDFAGYFALIAAADLVISADTSAVHIASAVDTPVVGLYGPNTPLLYGPWGAKGLAVYQGFDCSPCITNFNTKLNTCRHASGRGACMEAIEVADVFGVIRRQYLDPAAPFRLEKLDGR